MREQTAYTEIKIRFGRLSSLYGAVEYRFIDVFYISHRITSARHVLENHKLCCKCVFAPLEAVRMFYLFSYTNCGNVS